MGKTEVQATVIGEKDAREYTFLVEGRTNFMGLPLEEIRDLCLRPSLGQVRLMDPSDGWVELDTYFANAELLGTGISAILVPANHPFIGNGLLENRRFRVNSTTQNVERVPDDEFHPPFLR